MSVQRTIAAEARAIEEGHRAFIDFENGGVRVVSDTDDGLSYRVSASGYSDGSVIFECQPCDRRTGSPVEATHRRIKGHPGETPCKHTAVAARRLEREGFVDWTDDGWRIAAAYQWLLAVRDQPPADPFASFPKF